MDEERHRLITVGFICALLVFSGPVWGQEPRTHQEDVTELTLRHQEGIFLDSTLYRAIDHHLTIARSVADTLAGIHTFPRYVPTQLIVKPSGAWADTTWLQNRVVSGDPYLDSLGNVYGLVQVDGIGHYGNAILNFATPLEMGRLSELYEVSPLLAYAEPNGYCCDGDDIRLAKLNSVWDFAFSMGWGDCPAGCIDRHYWYVEVQTEMAELVLEMDRSFAEPIIYLWNIPPRYAVTMFASADTLIRAITDATEWWVRRHAIKASWRLAIKPYPWVGEDYDPNNPNSRWHTLKNQLLLMLGELHTAYTRALNDLDSDVVSSAEAGLDTLKASGLLRTDVFSVHPSNYRLDAPYPNPFNPTAHLHYAIPVGEVVSIVVYNLLGREVQSLWEGYRPPGEYELIWNGLDDMGRTVPSGVYFVHMVADRFQQTRKIILLR